MAANVENEAVSVLDGPAEMEQPVLLETAAKQNSRLGYRVVKRVFDIVVSLICLSIGLPFYLIIALAIVIDSPGNPLFFQKRVGKDGRIFTMVKFRTMYQGAEDKKADLLIHNEYESVHFKMTDDPRMTRTGRFLRRTSLDETPQALNLLTGTMSVIGPRPFIPEEQTQLPMDRLSVKPGLSCYWQITDTTKMSIEDQLELDYQYIREQGIKTDLKIIWMTIKLVFCGGNC